MTILTHLSIIRENLLDQLKKTHFSAPYKMRKSENKEIP